ncbi:MAG TPA: permease prefix domain 1-containing protein [Caulobacteraceae bacterium]|nr:permease prefix domain 1-containing protein [Caulobacteraceae bacterium]
MSTEPQAPALEAQISQWRNYLHRRQAIHTVDITELEDHLREQIRVLTDSGLADDEAFLVAVKRMGSMDDLSREFAREHSERLWKQLVAAAPDGAAPARDAHTEARVAFGLALAAALAIKLPALFGLSFSDEHAAFYLRNIAFFILPLMTGYFAWKRDLAMSTRHRLIAGFAVALLVANTWPPATDQDLLILSALHLPVALWLLVGVAYAGGRWSEVAGRMDFVRFSGELFIYCVLIALGGGLLMAFTALTFAAIGVDIEPVLESWLLPCGAMATLMVGAWLVEAKQSVIENMAPVLTRLFTPLFALMLLTFLAVLLSAGRGVEFNRELLITFDLLLVVVLALLLYSLSARDPQTPPGPFDVVQLVLVLAALAADAVALWSIASRISDLGFTPNRMAGLGLNLILLVNLTWAAVLSLRFLRGRGTFAAVERWQTDYLPVYAGWAVVVVVLFPAVFGGV